MRPTATFPLAVLAGWLILLVDTAAAGLPQRGRGPMMQDEAHQADMVLFHALVDHREQITRTVTVLPDGVETLTESTNPDVARMIRQHVESMLARVTEVRPIHQRDPLFRELFRYADQITATHEVTPNGVRVIERSKDPYVAKLIQAHAAVVSGYLANGRSEMMKNHEVPPR